MKYFFILPLLVLISITCTAQKSTPDVCYFLESTLKNERFIRLLKVDTMNSNAIKIVDEQNFFEKCKSEKIISKYNTFEISNDAPSGPKTYLECNNVAKNSDMYVVVMVNWRTHSIVEVFFKIKNAKWIIDHMDSGIM